MAKAGAIPRCDWADCARWLTHRAALAVRAWWSSVGAISWSTQTWPLLWLGIPGSWLPRMSVPRNGDQKLPLAQGWKLGAGTVSLLSYSIS